MVQILVQINLKDMEKATVNLFFDTRNIKANGKYPVKLTVYFDGDKKRYKTNIDVTQDEWRKLKSPKLKDSKLKETKLTLQAIENRASKIIEKMDEFSFEEFNRNFFSSTNKKLGNSFTELFKSYIDNLKSEERIGTATSYNTTLNSIIEFRKNIKYKDLTAGFLQQYEKYL